MPDIFTSPPGCCGWPVAASGYALSSSVFALTVCFPLCLVALTDWTGAGALVTSALSAAAGEFFSVCRPSRRAQ